MVSDDIRLRDTAGFGDAYRRHYEVVLAAATAVVKDRQLAEDVTQDVFASLWRRPSSFDPRRGDLRPYLRLLARSRAVDAWRSARSGAEARDRLEAAARTEGADADDPSRAAERHAEAAELRSAIRRLPEPQQEVLALRFYGGLTSSETAERLGLPVGTVKSRVRVGLQRLRALSLA